VSENPQLHYEQRTFSYHYTPSYHSGHLAFHNRSFGDTTTSHLYDLALSTNLEELKHICLRGHLDLYCHREQLDGLLLGIIDEAIDDVGRMEYDVLPFSGTLNGTRDWDRKGYKDS
jgi:hypothetical protein